MFDFLHFLDFKFVPISTYQLWPVLRKRNEMDERGGAVTAAKELMGLAKQGVCGIAQVRVRCLPVLSITP